MSCLDFHRIVVIGSTGSGKTTYAADLAKILGIPHIELDALYWRPNWTPAPVDEFRQCVASASSASEWVIDGNYGVSRDILWDRAEMIIWLDYSLWVVFWRLWDRTWQRWWKHELLWGTNHEPLLAHFMFWSDESLFRWLFKTYWRRKRQYPTLFSCSEYSHLQIMHFKKPRHASQWLDGISCG